RVRQRKPAGSCVSGSIPSSSAWAAAQAGRSRSKSSGVAARRPVSPTSGGSSLTYTGWPGRSSRGGGLRLLAPAPPSAPARLPPADPHPRGPSGGPARERAAVLARRDDVGADVAQRGQRPAPLHADELAEAPPRDLLEEDALDRLLGAEVEDLRKRRLREPA